MIHLRIENQNSNVEIVNAAIIQKIYNLASDIEQNLQEDEQLSDYVLLKGNLQSDHARQSAYEYLIGNLPDSNNKRFSNLTINLTEGAYIDFADSEVERVLLANNIGDGVGVSTVDAAATAIGNIFASNTTVQSFDEFDKFTASQAGNFSFNGCTNLTNLNLSNVTAITTNYCFQNVPLETFDAPRLTSFTALIPFGAYENSPKSNLKHVTNLGSITILGKNGSSNLSTFGYQSELLDVNLPTTCIQLGQKCFAKCIKLATINLDNIQVVGAEAFDCWGGSSKTVLSNVDSSQDLTSITSIGAFGFRGTRLGVTGGALNLPALTGSIGQWTFAGCPITSITSLGNATSIGEKAFYQCPVLATVSGISNVTSIGSDAFKECTHLTTIDLSESNITSIGGSAFSGCSSLASINIPNGITSISTDAFSGCTSLTSCTIGSGIISISARTFKNCSSLTNINIPSGITSIGTDAFVNCSSLASIVIPDSVTNIGSSAFNNCSSLASIVIPNNVTNIGGETFRGCSGLTSINIPDSVVSIGGSAFWGCDHITSCIIGNGLTSISNSAFKGCSRLTSCTIGSGVTSIGDNAFKECTTLTSVNSNNCTTVGASAFEGCTGLASVNLSNCATVGTTAFKGCTGLTTAVIGKLSSLSGDVFDWGRGIFVNCTALTTLDCGDVLQTIVFDPNSGAFSGTENLQTLIIRNTTPPTLNMDRADNLTLAEKLLSLGGPNVKIYVPDVSVYRADTNWAIFSDYLYNISALPSS